MEYCVISSWIYGKWIFGMGIGESGHYWNSPSYLEAQCTDGRC